MTHRFLQWLARDTAELRQANNEIVYLRAENRRLSDLLTQAWESSRVIPVQAEHRTDTPAQQEVSVSLMDLQVRLDREAEEQRTMYEASESRRQAAMKDATIN